MAAQPQASALTHVSEAKPVVLDGVRVFRGVYARGEDLLALGSLDGTRWVECDLDDTIWPSRIRDITLVDCSIRNSVWDLELGENIKIMGTKRIKVAVK